MRLAWRFGAYLVALHLALFALTRLPSGNLWDALLDPLLWLTLQFGWLFSALRRRWPAATRV